MVSWLMWRQVCAAHSIEPPWKSSAGRRRTIQTQGVIEAKVTVAFADLFTTQATALLALGGARKAIAFSIRRRDGDV